LKEYFDEYLTNEFDNSNGNAATIYAPFSHVSLSSIARRNRRFLADDSDTTTDTGRIPMDGIFNTEDASLLDIVPVPSGNLRKRHTEILAISKIYNGVGVFIRDGDLPIPSSNYLQAKQLQAQADESGMLLFKLKEAGAATGLNAVTSVALAVSTTGTPTPSTPAPQTTPDDSFDAVIIIAVVVAACSMMLLGFALYLAFRRRKDQDPATATKENVSPKTRETETSPEYQKSKRPVFEIKQSALQHDDAISAYTESVYSVPIAVKQAKKEWLKNAESHIRPAKASNRFNPRYIISSKRSNASSSADEGDLLFDNIGATEEMEGVPPMSTPMKKRLMETSHDMMSPTIVIKSAGVKSPAMDMTSINATPDSTQTRKKANTPALSESGLYPADVIDDDITSSLSAYGKGLGIVKHFRQLTNNADDGASVSSCDESYGFSLDGIGGDYTVANSTKYGY